MYYLMFYLMAESDLLPVLSLLAFLPQALLLLKTSFSFFRHLELVFFVNTAIFVTFNKVVTSQVIFSFPRFPFPIYRYCENIHSKNISFSQYFLWYLCILPLLSPYLSITKIETAVLTILWSGKHLKTTIPIIPSKDKPLRSSKIWLLLL